MRDDDNKRIAGVAEFCQTWPSSDIKGWQGDIIAELGKDVEEGGCWTGSKLNKFPEHC